MLRRLILVGVVAVALAGCGGSSASPSTSDTGAASAAPSSDSTSSSAPGGSEAASAAPTASDGAAASTSTAMCDGVSLRKQPKTTGAKVATVNSGTAVHVVATVSGTAYTAGACGTAGDTWLKIDRVAGKTAKSAYGVPYVYAAAGFFQ
jgi:hypothetical protein